MPKGNIKGGRKFFTELIDGTRIINKRGRNVAFNNKRNECLIDRYLYLLLLTDKRYEAILTIISNEFFISPVTVRNILQDNYPLLFSLKKEYQGYKEKQQESKFKGVLCKKWPHLVWVLN